VAYAHPGQPSPETVHPLLLERMDRRARRLATAQAITELKCVDRRLIAMLGGPASLSLLHARAAARTWRVTRMTRA
jgi:hypothetical protein